MIRAANVADPPDDLSQRSNTGQATKEGKKDSSDGFRVAQVDQGQTSSPSTVEKLDEKSSEKKKGEQLQEVVVTGSRIPLAAGQQSVQPVRSYTREDIDNSGQSTMGEFLNTLPDVSTSTASSQQLGIAGMQTVQLHGLPIGTTLTLLNGRRLEASSFGFFDLSNIPLSAVERIEILPVGASAIYGADALAGAVNMILRKNFSGFEANATLDHAPGVNDPGVNLAWGKSGERGSVSLIVSYEAHGELLGTQREPRSDTNFPANFPAVALSNDTCAPGNVYSVDGSNLPGLSSPHAGIPAGISGVPTIAQFAATAGKLNVCNAGRYVDITPESHREGTLLSAHYEFAESADLFTETLFSHKTLRYQVQPQVSAFASFGGTVAAANPYNPFGVDVNVSFVYPGSGLQEVQSTSLFRPAIGVRGAVFSDWHYEVTATLSRDRLHDDFSFDNFGAISAALTSSDPTTALNPFTSGAPGTPQLLQSLLGTEGYILDDQLLGGQGILRGSLLDLPAGALQTVIGGEYSHEKQDTTITNSGIPSMFLHRTSYAAFSEARIPLLAAGDEPRRGERVTLTLAGRYDHSSDYGAKATWQGALLWRALDSLSLTGSYGTSYQAPQLNEISGPQSTSFSPPLVFDPFRGNELVAYNVTGVFGPNFNLKPETGASSSLRVAYSGDAPSGLRASLTWYDLKISNYIGTPIQQVLVDNPNLFPGAVVRAPATPQDQQQGFLGVITQINQTFYNFGDIHVDGFDADVSYAIDTRLGQFTPSVAIANVYKWQAALTPSAPTIDGVSQATIFSVGWSPRWKGTATLAWKNGPLSANVGGRYIGRYLDYQTSIPNTHEIGNSWIFDVNARYEVGRGLVSSAPWLAGSYVAFGVVNVFNKIPPFSLNSYWYDIQEYDVRGRFLHLSAGVRF
jgi:iron complex outermembrane receptor protein